MPNIILPNFELGVSSSADSYVEDRNSSCELLAQYYNIWDSNENDFDYSKINIVDVNELYSNICSVISSNDKYKTINSYWDINNSDIVANNQINKYININKYYNNTISANTISANNIIYDTQWYDWFTIQNFHLNNKHEITGGKYITEWLNIKDNWIDLLYWEKLTEIDKNADIKLNSDSDITDNINITPDGNKHILANNIILELFKANNIQINNLACYIQTTANSFYKPSIKGDLDSDLLNTYINLANNIKETEISTIINSKTFSKIEKLKKLIDQNLSFSQDRDTSHKSDNNFYFKFVKPCEDNKLPYIDNNGYKNKCIKKKLYKNGLYKNIAAFTPLALIFLIGGNIDDELYEYYLKIINDKNLFENEKKILNNKYNKITFKIDEDKLEELKNKTYYSSNLKDNISNEIKSSINFIINDTNFTNENVMPPIDKYNNLILSPNYIYKNSFIIESAYKIAKNFEKSKSYIEIKNLKKKIYETVKDYMDGNSNKIIPSENCWQLNKIFNILHAACKICFSKPSTKLINYEKFDFYHKILMNKLPINSDELDIIEISRESELLAYDPLKIAYKLNSKEQKLSIDARIKDQYNNENRRKEITYNIKLKENAAIPITDITTELTILEDKINILKDKSNIDINIFLSYIEDNDNKKEFIKSVAYGNYKKDDYHIKYTKDQKETIKHIGIENKNIQNSEENSKNLHIVNVLGKKIINRKDYNDKNTNSLIDISLINNNFTSKLISYNYIFILLLFCILSIILYILIILIFKNNIINTIDNIFKGFIYLILIILRSIIYIYNHNSIKFNSNERLLKINNLINFYNQIRIYFINNKKQIKSSIYKLFIIFTLIIIVFIFINIIISFKNFFNN